MRRNLKSFRGVRCMTQQEFADKIGVDRQYYSTVERGRNRGSSAFWDKLQRAFEIPDAEMYPLQKLDEE